jgi:hypothetical protein
MVAGSQSVGQCMQSALCACLTTDLALSVACALGLTPHLPSGRLFWHGLGLVIMSRI